MATNIPPHNPTEIIDATLALIADPDITLEELMKIVPGPDFPTGGIILGRSGIRKAFETGPRLHHHPRARRDRGDPQGPRRDHRHEIPYQVNKKTPAGAHRRAGARQAGRGHRDLRDESDRSGMRIVIELKREATPEVVLNQLYRFTNLQTSFGINMLALDKGRPRRWG
jgi:DNA gyrase subunit A